MGAGRKKGSPNKTTVQLKDAILNAFAEVGGEKYLVRLAKEDPRTFCMLLGKVLPATLAGDPDEPVRIVPVLNINGVPFNLGPSGWQTPPAANH